MGPGLAAEQKTLGSFIGQFGVNVGLRVGVGGEVDAGGATVLLH